MTALRLFDVPEVLLSQEIPSDEVRMFPVFQTATKVLFAKVIPYKMFNVPVVLLSQEVPSDEVMIFPLYPPATNLLFA